MPVPTRLTRAGPGRAAAAHRARLWLVAAIKPPVKLLLWRPMLGILLASNCRAGLVLMYHDVGDRDGDPRHELVPPISRARFARQLAHLNRHYRLVELPDLQAAVAARRRAQPFPVALTFDDDLGHHVTHALPELRAADAPATFFLCGSFLEEPRDFWWQRLQRAADRGVDVAQFLGKGTIRQQGLSIQALAPGQRDAVADKLTGLVDAAPASELLTKQEARRLPRIGFHTVRHDPLTKLDDEQLARALVDGRAELSEFAGRSVDMIAYPHGLHDSRVVEAARRNEFTIGVTCVHEPVTPRSDVLALGRYEAPVRGPMAQFAFGLARTLAMALS